MTNRTFETFYADSIPVLMLPRDFVAAIYGEAALKLVPGDDVAAHLIDALKQPGSATGTPCCRRAPILPVTTPMSSDFRSSASLPKFRAPSGAAR